MDPTTMLGSRRFPSLLLKGLPLPDSILLSPLPFLISPRDPSSSARL